MPECVWERVRNVKRVREWVRVRACLRAREGVSGGGAWEAWCVRERM